MIKAFLSFLLMMQVFITPAQTRKDSLYAFVGEKIDIVEFNPNKDTGQSVRIQYIRDRAFVARYKVIQNVYGHYRQDTITFEIYDHYGTPPLSNYRNVLLFVRNYNGKLYHVKYTYNDVYKTKNGRWAGSYAERDYAHPYNGHTNIKPEKIDFVEEVSYKFRPTNTGDLLSVRFIEPYFRIENGRAIAVSGNYVEDLFELKKRGVLTAAGIFDPE